MAGHDDDAGSEEVWEVDDLPVLGEPFAVELANTDYRSAGEHHDVFAVTRPTTLWFRHAPTACDLTAPDPIPPATLASLRAVRDATRHLLSLAAAGTPGLADVGAVDVLNEHAASTPTHLVLGVDGTAPSWRIDHQGPAREALVAMVASRCILFLGGTDLRLVRRCARPGCPLLFVQRHRSRRFCHQSCAHRIRQARYYRTSLQSRKNATPNR